MNLKQLRIVREIIRANFNISDAADAIFTSQSGVSKHVKDLEDELGVSLFERRGKRLLGLTEPGAEVVKVIDRLLLEADNVKRVASQFVDSDSGTLTIATTHTQGRYSLPSVIAEFRKIFPQVNLVLHQASPTEIASILIRGRAEVGIATDTLDGIPELLPFPCYSWRHVVVVPNGHALLRADRVTLDLLAEHPIITYDRGLTGRSLIDGAFERAGLYPQVTIAALDSDLIKTYVALGLGVGIIAEMAFDAEHDRGLSCIDVRNLFGLATTSIAVRRGRHLRGYVYRFIELCAPAITESVIRAAEEQRQEELGVPLAKTDLTLSSCRPRDMD